MNLSELKTLSRKEMKKIMAGSGEMCDNACRSFTDCGAKCPVCSFSDYGSTAFCRP